MSRPIVNRKKCLGDVAAVYNPENVNNVFPLQIFPEGSIHLSGERELPPLISCREPNSMGQISLIVAESIFLRFLPKRKGSPVVFWQLLGIFRDPKFPNSCQTRFPRFWGLKGGN